MTDHNREELIEKAAATIAVAELVASHKTWGDLLEPQKDEYRRLAAQVLTVFEQAHTPTDDGHDGWCGCEKCEPDDEREALSEFLFTVYEHGSQPNALREADAILSFLAALRRPVQGEPGEHGGTIPLYGMLDVWTALYGTSHPEFDEFYAEHGYAETWARILAAVRERRTVQGEPTDAQVEYRARAAAGHVYGDARITPEFAVAAYEEALDREAFEQDDETPVVEMRRVGPWLPAEQGDAS